MLGCTISVWALCTVRSHGRELNIETQATQCGFQNKGTRTTPAQLSFVLKVPLWNLHPSMWPDHAKRLLRSLLNECERRALVETKSETVNSLAQATR